VGATLRPWLRFLGQSAYSHGTSTILVSLGGTFEWGRKSGKEGSVCVQTSDSLVRAASVRISGR